MKCSTCDNPYHPSTGHAFSPTVVACGPCARKFVAFVRARTTRRYGGVRFYDYATPPPAVDAASSAHGDAAQLLPRVGVPGSNS